MNFLSYADGLLEGVFLTDHEGIFLISVPFFENLGHKVKKIKSFLSDRILLLLTSSPHVFFFLVLFFRLESSFFFGFASEFIRVRSSF